MYLEKKIVRTVKIKIKYVVIFFIDTSYRCNNVFVSILGWGKTCTLQTSLLRKVLKNILNKSKDIM